MATLIPIGSFLRDLTTAEDLGNVSGNLNLATHTAGIISMTLTGDATLTVAGRPSIPEGLGGSVTLEVAQDSTGGRTLTIQNAVSGYSTVLTPTPDANAVDLIGIIWTARRVWATLMVPNGGVPAGWSVV